MLAVLVPKGLVCQYQVVPAGAVPLAVIVTPGTVHWGELEVGFGGSGGAGTTVPYKVTSSLPQEVLPISAFKKYNLKLTLDKLLKVAAGKLTVGVCGTVVTGPVAILLE